MKNINQLMKQAQDFQKKMEEIQGKLAEVESEGLSGGGLVKATVNGKGALRSLKLDPSVVSKEDVEMLEDLIIAAVNDAKSKSEAHMNEEMAKVTGGLNLGGLKLPF